MNTRRKWLIGGAGTAAVVLASGLAFAASRDHGYGGGHGSGHGGYGLHQNDTERGDRTSANSEQRGEGRGHHGISGEGRGSRDGERHGMGRGRDEGQQGMGRHMNGERHRDTRSGFGYGRKDDDGPRSRTEQKREQSNSDQKSGQQ